MRILSNQGRQELFRLAETLIVALAVMLSPVIADAPPVGWTTLARVVRVIDGDTVDVEVRRRIRVRLIDCWAPERGAPGGTESTQHLRGLLPDGTEVILHVPGSEDIRKAITFSRFAGRLYLDGDDVSELQIEAGHATREKHRRR